MAGQIDEEELIEAPLADQFRRQRAYIITGGGHEHDGPHLVLIAPWCKNLAFIFATSFVYGNLHDVRYTALGTLWSFIRPDGTLYGELKGGLRTDDNDTGVYRGITGGKYLADTKHGRTYRGAITFENTVGALAELNSVLAVFELEIDDSNKVNYRTWELV